MRRTTWTCDGCDRKANVEEGAKPSYWATVTIIGEGFTNWTAGGKLLSPMTRDLCGECQITMQKNIDPCRWPRVEKSA